MTLPTDSIALSRPQHNMLWRVAQHKYGWAFVSHQRGEFQVAEALERRGLVAIQRSHAPTIEVTDAGREEIKRRWPVSPLMLRTYEHQPGGWTPKDGEQ